MRVRLCMCWEVHKEKWEKMGATVRVSVCVCVHVCVYESEDLKAVQRHYSIKFMKAFTVTLAIK